MIAILDCWSRKIVGWTLSFSATVDDVLQVWEQALAAEGLLALEGPKPRPKALSDHGVQMKAKKLKAFFRDLGIAQLFTRPRTPEDNAFIETWFKTLKYEELYRHNSLTPYQVRDVIAAFVEYYNRCRPHQGLGYVTPEQKHTGQAERILHQRRQRLAAARQRRLAMNRAMLGQQEGQEVVALAA